jgi:ParB family chromosome partitioning protein
MSNLPSDLFIVPLNKLSLSANNVRKATYDDTKDLEASIPAHGLMHALQVEAGKKKGHFEVLAGGRRLTALQRLLERKEIDEGYEVVCRLVNGDALAVSLAENLNRLPMHYADQFAAFAELIENGKTIEQVSAAFGVSETVIRKRLKLGKVAPVILDAYRQDEIGFEQVTAYALVDDHERQIAVFTVNPRASSNVVRSALTQGEVTATDKRVKTIGLAAYEEAGGAIRKDLFTEGERGIFLLNVDLLDKLYAEHLTGTLADLKGEGWSDVVLFEGQQWQVAETYKGRVYPQPLELSEEQQAFLAELDAQLEVLHADAEDNETPELAQEIEKLEAMRKAIQTEDYTVEDKARSIAVLHVSYDGTLTALRGFMKKADGVPAGNAKAAALDAEGLPNLSAKLLDEMAAVRSAMIAAQMIDNPRIALGLSVYQMACNLMLTYTSLAAPVDLKSNAKNLSRRVETPSIRPFERMSSALVELHSKLPENPSDWFDHIINLDADKLMVMNAILLAQSFGAGNEYGMAHGDDAADKIAVMMDVKPADWTSLSEIKIAGRLSKSHLLSLVEKHCGKPEADKLKDLKKAELAERATVLLDGKWLPPQLNKSLRIELKPTSRHNLISELRTVEEARNDDEEDGFGEDIEEDEDSYLEDEAA